MFLFLVTIRLFLVSIEDVPNHPVLKLFRFLFLIFSPASLMVWFASLSHF